MHLFGENSEIRKIFKIKKNRPRLPVLRNEFIHYLAVFWTIIEKHAANSYKYLAVIIYYYALSVLPFITALLDRVENGKNLVGVTRYWPSTPAMSGTAVMPVAKNV